MAAEDEIDEEYRRLQAELEGVEGGEDGKRDGAVKDGVDGSDPKANSGAAETLAVVEAKPFISARSVVQPEWQQALYERDYSRMKMRNERKAEREVRPEAPKVTQQEPLQHPPIEADHAPQPPIGPTMPAIGPQMPPIESAQKTEALAQEEQPTKKRRKVLRTAAGEVWEDPTMEQWPENDHRIFVGDLAGDTTDEMLTSAFQKYDSFQMARIVQDKRTRKCKGFGFVSFSDAAEMVKALREMNGKYIGNRPVKLQKSTHQERNFTRDKREDVRLLRQFKRKHG